MYFSYTPPEQPQRQPTLPFLLTPFGSRAVPEITIVSAFDSSRSPLGIGHFLFLRKKKRRQYYAIFIIPVSPLEQTPFCVFLSPFCEQAGYPSKDYAWP